ncbi:MAG: EAL domain-containing protein [Campylobacterales bacterium]
MLEEYNKWNMIISKLRFAYKPIVNVHSGIVHGFEAVVVNSQDLGFTTMPNLLDRAYRDFVLTYVELQLRKKAAMSFLHYGMYENIKIFYKFDRHILSMPDVNSEFMSSLARSVNTLSDMICLEISEKKENLHPAEINNIFSLYRNQGYRVVIDNFGANSFHFKHLYNITPDYLKFDKFFTKNLHTDMKKRMLISKLIDISKTIGSFTIAKGVKSEEEFYACKDLGIDLVEGELISPAIEDLGEIKEKYDHILELSEKDRRDSIRQTIVEKNLNHLEPVYIDEDMFDVLEKFKRNKSTTFLPVLQRDMSPLGVLLEKELKDYVYSAFGTSLLKNKSASIGVKKFMVKCATADINTRLEGLLKSFSATEDSVGILITKDTKYYAFLSSKELLRALNEQSLEIARDQNPLTKLPGNIPISNFIIDSIQDMKEPLYLAYFDFDNFKPFNDKYGFRLGDRAILMFSEILRNDLQNSKFFLGHIGGDDFFVGYKGNIEYEEFCEHIEFICESFKTKAKSLYKEDDRKRGTVVLKDREGKAREFKLLSVSASIVEIRKGSDLEINKALDATLSTAKKSAKEMPNNICAISVIAGLENL